MAVLGVVYVIATALLIAYGYNLAFLSWAARRRPAPVNPEPLAVLPRVTVQLPIYNELYVSARVIEAVCRLDYPADLLEIQVLDDSTDETVEVVGRAIERARDQGVNIVHVRRKARDGFKAGALAHALDGASGEFIAIFDADFVPDSDFLRRTLPHFCQPDIAFVQGRWGHLNREQSNLTRLQALAIDAHFLVEQNARATRGYWFNFNGTAGVWRAAAIRDAGGWTAETLTEDLDLSYRAHLHGWRGKYLPDVVVRGEVPPQMSGFRRQQHRWARGSLECAIKLLPQIWKSSARTPVKLQATAHLTSYSIHLLLFTVMLLYPLVVLAAADHPAFRTFFGLAYPFALFSLAPLIFLVAGQAHGGRGWLREVPRILALAVISPGLMLNTVRAAYEIYAEPNPEFERTAKFGTAAVSPAKLWTRQRYQLGLDPIVWLEMFFGAYGLGTAWLALQHRNWAILFYAAVFGVGLLTVATLTLGQSLAVFRSRENREAQRHREEAAWNEQLQRPARSAG